MKKYYSVIKQNMMEFLKFKNYHQMHIALAIFSFIVMLPFIIGTFVIFGLLSVVYFFFYLMGLPAEFLLSFIRQEGKEVKHATQTVIYIIGFPVIFLWYLYMSLSIFAIYIGNIFFEINRYYGSLAGVPFKANLGKAAEALDGNTPAEQSDEKRRFVTEPLVLIVVNAALYFLGTLASVLFIYVFGNQVLAFAFIEILYILPIIFTLIFVPLAFGRKKQFKEKKKATRK
jgi:hypothetical protein